MTDAKTVPKRVTGASKCGQDRPPCLCGCGGYPKGKLARFIPGHDARYHAAQKQAVAEPASLTRKNPKSAGRPSARPRPSPAKDGATEALRDKPDALPNEDRDPESKR